MQKNFTLSVLNIIQPKSSSSCNLDFFYWRKLFFITNLA